jgi:uncharacterized protein (TIGR02452 family)
MGYFDHKESMQIKAYHHTKEVGNRYKKEIDISKSLSTIYYEAFNPAFIEGSPTRVEVIDAGSVEAAFNEYNNGAENGKHVKPCILNFASYKNPGGKFIEGSSAQEECLCHASNLYNILEKFDKDYYAPHRTKGATNRALYNNQAIFTPDVIFNHGNKNFKCDVLTCAAPNYAAAKQYYDVSAKENAEVLLDRIKFLRKILEDNHVKTVILGAYGCGVFGQDPNLVAKYMNDVFKDSNIDTIVYAIPRGLNKRNYLAFKNKIAETEV